LKEKAVTNDDRRYITDLISATGTLFLEGCNDPAYEDVLKKHFRGVTLPPNLEALLNKGQEERLRKGVEEAGHVICPLSDKYYTKYKREPETDDEIKQSLPGPGKKTVGFYRVTGDPLKDRMWIVWTRWKNNRNLGANDKIRRDVMKVLDGGLIAADEAEQLLGNRLPLDPKTAAMIEAVKRIYGGTPPAIESPDDPSLFD
jgi:hypothetical protein